ncbi:MULTISPECIES: hypothetical protein [unclassified Streptomyces]|nr:MULTISPECIES: hypothetical protein [unclassified Streptomyces]SCG03519.1 hypothetical protein GA0115259_108385 [Streptomyces sp. MnatMP-M17]
MTANQEPEFSPESELAATEVVITEEELDDVSGASLPIPRLLNP